MKITVTIKNVYGRHYIYPACETARKFGALLGTKTLTLDAIEHIKRLGYTVEVVSTTPATL